MTSKLLRIVPMVLSLSIPALAADPPPAADAKHDTKDAKKKDKKDEKKDEKKEEKKEGEKK